MTQFVQLSQPPVAIALFQMKFNANNISIEDFEHCDSTLKSIFPIRKDNVSVGINLQSPSIPLGKASIKGTSDAKLSSLIYATTEQKEKLEISKDTITYIDENKYLGWERFKNNVLKTLTHLSQILDSVEISRLSIRFVNKFDFPEFSNPQDYVTTVITNNTGETQYPIRQYGFRMFYDVPDTNIYAIVNQNVEKNTNDNYSYVLDIDVLDRQSILFQLDTISNNLETIRRIKNELFFESITKKTIELCK